MSFSFECLHHQKVFFFFFLTEHNLYKFAHNEVSSIYTLICNLNPRLTLLTIKTGLTEVLNQVWCSFAAVLQLKSLLNPGRYFGFREYSLKTFIGYPRKGGLPKVTAKRATKNLQLVLQHCCKKIWIAMLLVLPPTNEYHAPWTVARQVRTWVAKRAISLLNSFCRNFARCTVRPKIDLFVNCGTWT